MALDPLGGALSPKWPFQTLHRRIPRSMWPVNILTNHSPSNSWASSPRLSPSRIFPEPVGATWFHPFTSRTRLLSSRRSLSGLTGFHLPEAASPAAVRISDAPFPPFREGRRSAPLRPQPARQAEVPASPGAVQAVRLVQAIPPARPPPTTGGHAPARPATSSPGRDAPGRHAIQPACLRCSPPGPSRFPAGVPSTGDATSSATTLTSTSPPKAPCPPIQARSLPPGLLQPRQPDPRLPLLLPSLSFPRARPAARDAPRLQAEP